MKIKRCTECSRRHLVCNRSTVHEVCHRCQTLSLDCVTLPRRKGNRQTGQLLRAGKANHGFSIPPPVIGPIVTTFVVGGEDQDVDAKLPTPVSPSSGSVIVYPDIPDMGRASQNLSPTSYENYALRRSELRSSLTFTLMMDGTTRIAMLFRAKGCLDDASGESNEQFAKDVSKFFVAFEATGMNEKSESLGELGETKVALFRAVGAYRSNHSAIIGTNPDAVKISELAILRDQATVVLWRHFFESWERRQSVGSDFAYEELTLLACATSFTPGFCFKAEQLRFHQLGLQHFIKVHGILKPSQRLAWFEFFLTDDAHFALYNLTYPSISDQAILKFKSHPSIDARIYLTWDKNRSKPEPQNYDDYLETMWGLNIGLERMVAFAVSSADDGLPSGQIRRVVDKTLDAFAEYREYRSTITWTEMDPFGIPIKYCQFGVEAPFIARDELTRKARGIFSILSMMVRQVHRSPELGRESELLERCRDAAIRVIGEIHEMFIVMTHGQMDLKHWETYPNPMVFNELMRCFSYLPGGVEWLANYLLLSPTESEFLTRGSLVRWLLGYFQVFAHEGRSAFENSIRLEGALKRCGLVLDMVANALQGIALGRTIESIHDSAGAENELSS